MSVGTYTARCQINRKSVITTRAPCLAGSPPKPQMSHSSLDRLGKRALAVRETVASRHNGEANQGSPQDDSAVMYGGLQWGPKCTPMIPRDASLSNSYTCGRCFSRPKHLQIIKKSHRRGASVVSCWNICSLKQKLFRNRVNSYQI